MHRRDFLLRTLASGALASLSASVVPSKASASLVPCIKETTLTLQELTELSLEFCPPANRRVARLLQDYELLFWQLLDLRPRITRRDLRAIVTRQLPVVLQNELQHHHEGYFSSVGIVRTACSFEPGLYECASYTHGERLRREHI